MPIAFDAATLRRHKAIVGLMLLSACLTVAVVSNATHAVATKWRVLEQPSGLDERRTIVVQAHDFDITGAPGARQRSLLAKLRAQPGVDAVASVGTMTFLGDLATPISAQPPGVGSGSTASLYIGSEDFLDALGVRVIAGEGFGKADFMHFASGEGLAQVGTALLTRDLARQLFGTDQAVGRVVYLGTARPLVVKGIVANVMRPNPSLREPETNAMTAFVALVPDPGATTIVLRAGNDISALVQSSSALVEQAEGDWSVVRATTLHDIRAAYFDHESNLVATLLFGSALLLLATVMGLAGLSAYWVAQRRRSIEIRRAIGATRGDIVLHFLVENTLVMTMGSLAGVVVALVIGQILHRTYDVPPIALGTVGVSAAAMVVLGWLTVLKPAIDASRTPKREP